MGKPLPQRRVQGTGQPCGAQSIPSLCPVCLGWQRTPLWHGESNFWFSSSLQIKCYCPWEDILEMFLCRPFHS